MVEEFKAASEKCIEEVKGQLEKEKNKDFGAIRFSLNQFKGTTRVMGTLALFKTLESLQKVAENERDPTLLQEGLKKLVDQSAPTFKALEERVGLLP